MGAPNSPEPSRTARPEPTGRILGPDLGSTRIQAPWQILRSMHFRLATTTAAIRGSHELRYPAVVSRDHSRIRGGEWQPRNPSPGKVSSSFLPTWNLGNASGF